MTLALSSTSNVCPLHRGVRGVEPAHGPVPSHLLDGADGDAGRAGDHDVPGLDVGAHLLQDEGDDGRLHGQEEDIAVLHRVLVAHREVHSHFLHPVWGETGTLRLGTAREGSAPSPVPAARPHSPAARSRWAGQCLGSSP